MVSKRGDRLKTSMMIGGRAIRYPIRSFPNRLDDQLLQFANFYHFLAIYTHTFRKYFHRV